MKTIDTLLLKTVFHPQAVQMVNNTFPNHSKVRKAQLAEKMCREMIDTYIDALNKK